jgi:hypothetical protein
MLGKCMNALWRRQDDEAQVVLAAVTPVNACGGHAAWEVAAEFHDWLY